MLNIDKFLEYLCSELNRSPRTVESYRDDLTYFEKFAKGLSDSFSWETVDSDMVRNWMESMMDKGNSAATVERRLHNSLRKVRWMNSWIGRCGAMIIIMYVRVP